MAGYGSITRTDAGITFSRGRKGNKTSLDVAFRDIARWARRNRAEMPRLIRKASGSAARTLQSKLRKIMKVGGGIDGVPQFKELMPFTKDVRALEGDTSPIGGILSQKNNIVKYVRGNLQIIGWPSALANVAIAFQDGAGNADDRFADPGYRKYWHRRGIEDVPTSYTHNRRDVLTHFGATVDANLKTWKKQILDKEIARRLAKSRGWVD